MRYFALVAVCMLGLMNVADAQCYGRRCYPSGPGYGMYYYAPRYYGPRNYSGFYPRNYSPHWRYFTPWRY
jgi:hypothetical protein